MIRNCTAAIAGVLAGAECDCFDGTATLAAAVNPDIAPLSGFGTTATAVACCKASDSSIDPDSSGFICTPSAANCFVSLDPPRWDASGPRAATAPVESISGGGPPLTMLPRGDKNGSLDASPKLLGAVLGTLGTDPVPTPDPDGNASDARTVTTGACAYTELLLGSIVSFTDIVATACVFSRILVAEASLEACPAAAICS